MRTSNIVQTTQSTQEISGNAFAMGIDENSTVFLMDALGKLYARPAQAALREYLSNAIDAHRAKGGKLPPIQITLPTKGSSKNLLVRDFGKGMNEKEFETILSRYGASTKRDSNKQIGGFGLGAKSGFAVSDEFFMTSYQQGKGFRVRIFKNALNQGYVDVIDRFSTNEPDGMLVEVPIPDGNLYELSNTALVSDVPFFAGYDAAEIDIQPALTSNSVHNEDAYAPLSLAGEITGWLRKPDSTLARPAVYALIGTVVYPLDMSNIRSFAKSSKAKDADTTLLNAITMLDKYKRQIFLNIPIGSVDLPSSRENIIFSERSLRTINAAIVNFAALMEQYFQKEVNSKKTRFQVLSFLHTLESSGVRKSREFTWQGQQNPLHPESLRDSSLHYYRISNEMIMGNGELGSRLNSFAALKDLSSSGLFHQGMFRVTFDSYRELSKATKLSKHVFIDLVSKYRKPAGLNDNALLVFSLKEDPLYDWFWKHEEISPSELEVILKKQADEKAQLELKEIERKAKEAEKRKKAKVAKDARASGMLSNFTVSDSKGSSLSRNMVEQVFKKDVRKFYWSEQEVEELKAKRSSLISDSILFPFRRTDTPNTFTVVSEKDGQWRTKNLLVVLRQLLRMFMPFGSRVVVIDKSRDLEEFKAEFPQLESGVKFVQSSIEEQMKDATSNLMLVRSAFASSSQNAWKFREIAMILQSFKGELGERVPAELAAMRDNFFNLNEMSSIIDSLGEKWFNGFMAGFNVSPDSNSAGSYSPEDDLKLVREKYPLLAYSTFKMSANGVPESLIKYLEMCEKEG